MSSPSGSLPPSDSTTPASSSAQPRTYKRVLARGLVLALAIAGYAWYALSHPASVPLRIGEYVEDVTGYNARPVHLVLPPKAPLSSVAVLGRQIFYDATLSASGKQSCASCHNPEHAYAPANDLSVQFGGPHLDQAGIRPPPSLAYLYRQGSFSIGPDLADSDTAVNLNALAAAAAHVLRADKIAGQIPLAPAIVPQGGLFWDGRADSFQRQAIVPLLNPAEMANGSLASVADKLRRAPYADTFKQLFGPRVLQDSTMLVSEAMFAIGRYEFEDASFHPFTSKYDYWLQGKVRLTRAEMRGLRLFNDPETANCAGCHLSKPTPDGLPPLFTDTQYEALAVPRNAALPVNRDPHFYDLGVCGPIRQDVKQLTQYCGMFLTPSLRNTATRHAFFHNGVYHSLKQVLDFYNLRAAQPEKIYPVDATGHVQKYDDIPVQYWRNVDTVDAPFNRKVGQPLPMSDQDMQDIIAFLGTLTDGYQPRH